MGRLRDDYENPLFQCIAEEVVDLYGVDDAYIYRFWSQSAANLADKDPLWGEPSTKVKYTRYKIKLMFLEYDDDETPNESGYHDQLTNKIYIAVNHFIKAGVPKDHNGDFCSPEDRIRVHYLGDQVEYFVTNVDRVGWINDTDKYTGLELTVNRNTKFVPERMG